MLQAAVALSALLLVVSPGIVAAQTVTPTPDIQLKRDVTGVYDITVFSTPPEPVEGLGGPRFSVRVLGAQDGEPVDGVTVVIALNRPDGIEAGQVPLGPNPSASGIYEARITVPDVGTWTWTVAVTGPEALESVDGTITIVPGPSAGRAGTVAWLIMIGVLLTLGLAAYFNLRPKKRRDAA